MCVNPHDTLYQCLDSARQEIRILSVQPCRDPFEEPTCRLQTVSLLQRPSFRALSYCWDQTQERSRILVNGQHTNVTPALLSAIKHLHEHYGLEDELVLWIDAICIDQTNLVERAEQVRLMRDIYGKAAEVVAWLGEAEEDTHLAVELLKRMFEKHDRTQQESPDEVLEHTGDERRGFLEKWTMSIQLSLTVRYTNALRRFYEASWWLRTWTLQEAVLNPNISLHVGKHSIVVPGWEVVGSCQRLFGITLSYKLANLSSNMDKSEHCTPSEVLTALQAANMLSAAQSVPLDALMFSQHAVRGLEILGTRLKTEFCIHILGSARQRGVTDDRDRVYALMGLLSNTFKALPDYTISVEQVYEDATFDILQYTKSLRPLLTCYSFPGSAPSWVIDPRQKAPISFITKEGEHVTTKMFDCSKCSRVFIEHTQEHTLITRSMRVDKVEHIMAQAYQVEEELLESFMNRASRFHEDHVNALSPLSEDMYWRVICSGMLRCRQGSMNLRRYVDSDREILRRVCEGSSFSKVKEPLLQQQSGYVAGMLWGKVLFQTAAGQFGTCLPHVAPGDEIHILQGAPIPCVLRKDNARPNAYQFLGGCWLSGIMDGEAIIDAPGYTEHNEDWMEDVFSAIILI